ncbi:uncharacterized protein MELLADRAFT_103006 [Melampsora larici-populina 98AG31]|uniref:Uncharacterized protein n=1 Tax=Melampsora larici-populina (strain 98AG31 / pathotype 3-4-7) TaxID=747676 RepID=F4RA89_MELLP|nr:uncharacterized protein MELLADRAFT_103006 [Melampsora larici-populina 98AG31]EGG10822.1 hypothetical protein MELLADRAFT_103006 [Melampsora larici-populina 98AG31]
MSITAWSRSEHIHDCPPCECSTVCRPFYSPAWCRLPADLSSAPYIILARPSGGVLINPNRINASVELVRRSYIPSQSTEGPSSHVPKRLQKFLLQNQKTYPFQADQFGRDAPRWGFDRGTEGIKTGVWDDNVAKSIILGLDQLI